MFVQIAVTMDEAQLSQEAPNNSETLKLLKKREKQKCQLHDQSQDNNDPIKAKTSKYEVMWNITIGKTVLSGEKKKKNNWKYQHSNITIFFFLGTDQQSHCDDQEIRAKVKSILQYKI